MHVYEPALHRKRKQARKAKTTALVGIGALILIVLSVYVVWANNKSSNDVEGTNMQSGSTNAQTATKYFSGYDFQKLYEITALPNTERIAKQPAVTGNQSADMRIHQIAESRGHKLQALPQQSIILVRDIMSNDNLLQLNARESWLQLKSLAAKDNIRLSILSGYLSIDRQRQLFADELYKHTTADLIAAGKADAVVASVVEKIAPPGYSRHHTGYAMDLACINEDTFDASTCHKWLSADNYAKAKQVGLIPSVAEKVGIGTQSEYVWVGTSKFL